MIAGALPGGSGDVPVNPFLSVPGPAAPAYLGAEGAGVGLAVGSMFFTGVEAGSTYGPPGAVIGGILGAIAGVLEDIFGGGGPSEPWWWTREDTHPGGSPSTWAPILGLPAAYPPNQEKSMLLPVVPQPSGRSSFGPETGPFGGRVKLVGDPLGQPTPTPAPTPGPTPLLSRILSALECAKAISALNGPLFATAGACAAAPTPAAPGTVPLCAAGLAALGSATGLADFAFFKAGGCGR